MNSKDFNSLLWTNYNWFENQLKHIKESSADFRNKYRQYRNLQKFYNFHWKNNIRRKYSLLPWYIRLFKGKTLKKDIEYFDNEIWELFINNKYCIC